MQAAGSYVALAISCGGVLAACGPHLRSASVMKEATASEANAPVVELVALEGPYDTSVDRKAEYLEVLHREFCRSWNARPALLEGLVTPALAEFVIRSDGKIREARILTSSGAVPIDGAILQILYGIRGLPPLRTDDGSGEYRTVCYQCSWAIHLRLRVRSHADAPTCGS
jgi:hypothetical protein